MSAQLEHTIVMLVPIVLILMVASTALATLATLEMELFASVRGVVMKLMCSYMCGSYIRSVYLTITFALYRY